MSSCCGPNPGDPAPSTLVEKKRRSTADTGLPLLRPARADDYPQIEGLLTESALPLDGVRESLHVFTVAEHDGALVGVVGLEACGSHCALLRSTAVRPEWRGVGLGRRLVEHAIASAESRGLRALWLLTTTAERYFPSFGFVQARREDAPPEARATAEFTSACPSSAAVMTLALPRSSAAAASASSASSRDEPAA